MSRSSAVVASILAAVWTAGCRSATRPSLRIDADRSTVAMGRTVVVTAAFAPAAGESPERYLLLPYVNGRRWGSHERPNREGRAEFLLPLPNPLFGVRPGFFV